MGSKVRIVSCMALVSACGMDLVGPAMAKADHCGAPVASVVTDQSGRIAITYRDPVNPRTEIIDVGHPFYEEYRSLVGAVPGRSTVVRASAGTVRMNADGSLLVKWSGGRDGAVHAEPLEETLRKEDAGYRTLVARVGGISPGGVKFIPESCD